MKRKMKYEVRWNEGRLTIKKHFSNRIEAKKFYDYLKRDSSLDSAFITLWINENGALSQLSI